MSIDTLKFDLKGDMAFFKKPDINVRTYLTYNNIHKVAILGILGAIIGLKGYRNEELFGKDKKVYPEFYEKLNGLKVSIIPNSDKGYFRKKIQYFNNSVGYASKEEGGNLMVYEQWIEYPDWTIYLWNDGSVETSIWEKLEDYMIKGKSVYIPYLGKNDFPANIDKVEKVKMDKCGGNFINSVFIGELDYLDDEETLDDEPAYIFTEYAPIGMIENYNFYDLKRTIYTNCMVVKPLKDVYTDGEKVISFF
ncbi:type I-B CRISPR-associated protein Cas5b [Thermoanaerobacterium thermosaccharolyticum]|uniref:type I-B CRISPR-associated protein Cas5b n=1 Tax=Thermoanaerobacterium thermosaccharolyticum TaxID=1517 RepID=UPI002FDAD59D